MIIFLKILFLLILFGIVQTIGNIFEGDDDGKDQSVQNI